MTAATSQGWSARLELGATRARESAGAAPGPTSLRILIAAAEAYPFVKVGGLADVCGALPKALAELGHEVRLVLPAYRGLPGRNLMTLNVPLGAVDERIRVSALGTHGGVEVFTLGADGWFDREVPYGYDDAEILPFILFSKAVVRLAATPGWLPDVIHCHDWHCGLLAQEVRQGADRAALSRTGVVLTIHNLAYQGHVGAALDRVIGLTPSGSLLCRGITYSDRVNTVSRGYLQEILTPRRGDGLDSVLRSRGGDVSGILNGVDYTEFTPERDRWITTRYDGSFVYGKRRNKEALQRQMGLELSSQRPVFGVVSRMVAQKGVNLLSSALDGIVHRGGQVVIMGEGDLRYRTTLAAGVRRNAGSVAFRWASHESLARQVYAGSDFVLVPSMFEPCGLTPLIGLRYGTIPIVRHTGGMIDTIGDYAADPATGLGFVLRQHRVSALLSTVDDALAVFRRKPEWRDLQRRAMAADFSWKNPAQEYVELYRSAMASAGAPQKRGTGRSVSTRNRTPLPLALVHHANQYLVTDGYPDREGLSSLVHGYAAVLELHRRYRIPAHLHLSGTLIEAIAWWQPWFFKLVQDLRASGLISLIGGTYSENVLTAFDADFNHRQLKELLWLYERHLGCTPEEVTTCWVPERVWNTDRLAPQLTDPCLPNGGYRYVLLDDRLLYPTGRSYDGSDRQAFDLADPTRPPPADAMRVYRLQHGEGLQVIPMSTRLRYWIPPAGRDHWRSLSRTTDVTVAPGDDAILVYADDMERPAGVGAWAPEGRARYEAFLRWLSAQPDVVPVSLPDWLARDRRTPATRRIDPGTFLELARTWNAGEDYRSWSNDPAWRGYGRHLARVQRALEDAESAGADAGLLALGWKHLLASAYETAWHDTTHAALPPAAWTKALGSHARSGLALAAAARWFGGETLDPEIDLVDIDDDGEEELVLRNHQLYAVVAPDHGGRLVLLAGRSRDGAALLIGNPTDDWNWQEELNQYMRQPANHPGALADVGFQHDRYRVSMSRTGGAVMAELTNVEQSSPMRGARKRLLLRGSDASLVVAYHLPDTQEELVTEACLSPDYLTLLRRGRRAVRREHGDTWRGARTGEVAAWVARSDEETSAWVRPSRREVGHGLMVGLRVRAPGCHLVIGGGPVSETECEQRVQDASIALATAFGSPIMSGSAEADDGVQAVHA